MKFIKYSCLSLLLCSAISMKGQSGSVLVVEQENNKKSMFVLAEKPELSFADHKLKISVSSKQTDFEISTVKQFFFEQISASIANPTADNLKIEYQSNEQVVIEGIERNAVIQLYSINGMQCTEQISIDNNRAVISLSSLSKGTYIINIANKQTFKIFKK